MDGQYRLRELDFSDRVFVSLSVEPDLSTLRLETEAWLPQGPEGRLTKLGWIKCALGNVCKADIHVKPGFHQDASLPYNGVRGADVRGNEIYLFTEEELVSGGRLVRLVSDLLELEVVCETVEIDVIDSQ